MSRQLRDTLMVVVLLVQVAEALGLGVLFVEVLQLREDIRNHQDYVTNEYVNGRSRPQ